MIGNLPNDTLTEVFRKVANQADKLAAFYEINALRSTNQRFRELIESDRTIRSEFRKIQQETRPARFANARIEARNPAGTRTGNDINTYHDVDVPDTQDRIKWLAAERDINANPDMVARTAIERNDVVVPVAQDRIKWLAAKRDINANPDMVAGTAIERNDVTDRLAQDTIKERAAKRDINANMVARTAIERNGVTDRFAQNRIMQHAASVEAFSNAIRGLGERFRQEGGRGR
ncbi:hypothetical protein E0H39_38335 [Rhizobium leguminosarum bv. viciae]|uniref:hypothetical protein n=1 Tax=Rhizobium leguminosarum TaxID=384 RepID=UPI00103AC83D|nr:hypothetical protein [Rhizobium leguminosarum]NKK54262.1 hypothetical protein [Rhizobium leguminosarum bv. viciae]QIJ45662.1 hypothetical protein G7039_36940 [Rhizobium leguminosarum]TBY52124.1 hypothetical protein E0H39_38335 [Rhizobium leguminosarum bv. viciae]TBY88779.1 hypothetical protein E0H49_36630 [Rhizobium leguminosarum bv. viciae]